ncbi:hypothetical protein BD779DRAFT_1500843 [Infundibulicybe gibba]|nr:hypothetical protein BD779DRAFT_1500843 [Infundibulicybe gibba]
MSRLASFRGPSTPTHSPVQRSQKNDPSSPSRLSESTYHRKLRTLLQELQSIAETWEDLVRIDGLKAIRILVDTRTDLNNALSLLPDRRPQTHLVGPKLVIMEKCIVDLDRVVSKLRKQFHRIGTVVDNLDALLADAHRVKGWKYCQDEPLWVTWPLEKFVNEISVVLIPYHRSLAFHEGILKTLRSHSISFNESRDAISSWAAQPPLEDGGWGTRWADICAVEVDRWDLAR